MGKVITIANQKGGVAKSTTCINVGIGLARHGKKVLLIDADAQGNISQCLGIMDLDNLETTLVSIIEKILNDEEMDLDTYILHNEEGVDFIPGNIQSVGLDYSLYGIRDRELVMKHIIDLLRDRYDYILIDTMPSLGMLTINALVAADSVLIPVESSFWPAEGLQQLIKTIGRIHRNLNPNLTIEGILLTKVDRRTNFARDVSEAIRETYGSDIRIFKNPIPMSIRAAEMSARRSSIFLHSPDSNVAKSYEALVKEVLGDEAGR